MLDVNENSNMYVSNPEEEEEEGRVKAIKASFISTGFCAAKRRWNEEEKKASRRSRKDEEKAEMGKNQWCNIARSHPIFSRTKNILKKK